MARITLEPLPHREAIEYFRSKGHAHALQRFDHLDVWREQHARDWVVAKAMRDDVSNAIRAAVDRKLAEGQTIESAIQELAPRLKEMGWWGKELMEDPVTGEMKEVQLGSMHRLRTIFDTNMRTAHAAGHWAAIQRTKQAFPYLHYIQIDRPTKRHSHARFHDRIWRVDDPVWLRIFPPNGYFCGCVVIQRTEGWMRRNGRTVDETLDLQEEEWTHERSGETHMIPRGIHPGFDTNPGATWLDIEARHAEATPDLSGEQRGRERGYLLGLRQRRLQTGRESVLLAEVDGPIVSAMGDADPATPDQVTVDARAIDLLQRDGGMPARLSVLHSHLTNSPLSHHDLFLLGHPALTSVTAITAGGSIWRARQAQVPVTPRLLVPFQARAADLPSQLDDPEVSRLIVGHAMARFLERRSAIHYHTGLSSRDRQILAALQDLIDGLSQ